VSNIEDVLRQFRPAREPEGFWNRVVAGKVPEREPRPGRRLAWALAAAAALLFAFILALVSGAFRSGVAPAAPELALQRIREALETSETACIRFTLEPEGSNAAGGRKTGVVFLKRGNKVNLSVKEWPSSDVRGTPEMEARLISDGSRMERCLLRRGNEVEAQELKPESIAPGLADWYLRGGNLASWPTVVDVGRGVPIRDVKTVPGTAQSSAVSYRVGDLTVTLWYDPTTFKPLRRSFRSEGRGSSTETYQEYEFNEEMPDSLFALAKEK
jgi:outer membrane lipoprotein-sorting protein